MSDILRTLPIPNLNAAPSPEQLLGSLFYNLPLYMWVGASARRLVSITGLMPIKGTNREAWFWQAVVHQTRAVVSGYVKPWEGTANDYQGYAQEKGLGLTDQTTVHDETIIRSPRLRRLYSALETADAELRLDLDLSPRGKPVITVYGVFQSTDGPAPWLIYGFTKDRTDHDSVITKGTQHCAAYLNPYNGLGRLMWLDGAPVCYIGDNPPARNPT